MKLGAQLEDFSLSITGGDDAAFRLSAYRGRIIVLYFYPKDDTPGCTLEGKDFSALLPSFEQAGAVVLGVSRDGIRSHEKFRDKYGYAHHLLADTDAALCKQFGVLKEKTMFGKPVTGISRSTFIIDGDGRLAGEWRGIKDVTDHAQTVLSAVQSLASG